MKKIFDNLYIFIIGIISLLMIYLHNFDKLSINVIFRPLVIVFTVNLIVFIIIRFITKNNIKILFVYFVFQILFFSYGQIYLLIKGYEISGIVIGRHNKLLIIYAIIFFGLSVVLLFLKTKIIYLLKNFSNLFSLVLFLILFIQLSLNFAGKIGYKTEIKNQKENNIKFDLQSIDYFPNIYVIVLDAYTGNNILKTIYGFDNQDFISKLKKRGFNILDNICSNYGSTTPSIASIFNMDYIHNLIPNIQDKSYSVIEKLVFNNFAVNNLRFNGYKFLVYSPHLYDSDFNKADVIIELGFPIIINEFEQLFIHSTLLTVIPKLFTNSNKTHRRIVTSKIIRLSEPLNEYDPFILYAHIEAPRPPFLFDKNGNPINDDRLFSVIDGDLLINVRMDKETYKKQYIGQLEYLNKLILKSIDNVLNESQNPPIVLLIGDHGSRMLTEFNNPDPDTEQLQERFSILYAYYFPNIDIKINDDFSPVNTFRVIFNNYFGSNLELLPPKNYYSTNNEPTNYIDITNKLKN